MAKGRRDYTWGVLQDSILPGKYSTNFYDGGICVPDSGEGLIAVTYTVPDGFKLFLLGVILGSRSPALNDFGIKKNDLFILYNYFEMTRSLNLGTYGAIPFDEGDKLEIYFKNNDTIAYEFYANIIGVMEELV